MKTGRFILAAILGVSLLFVSCKEGNKEERVGVGTQATKTVPLSEKGEEVAGKIEKATFQIEGMTCAMGCAKMIENKLGNLEGVKEAKVDFENKTAVVEFDDAKQNGASLKETVEKNC
jgi:Cu+-exporting ATPase